MTKKHIDYKVFAELRAELSEKDQRKVVEICDVHGYDPSVMTKKDIVLKIINLALSNDGVQNVETEIECAFGTRHGDHIDCAKDFDQKGRIHKVTPLFCDQCWERQQRKKLEHRTTEVQAMKAEIHRHQQSVNQTIKEKGEVIICPKTDVVIPADQCKNCDPAQQKKCQRVMRDSDYQKELAKVRTLIE